MSLLRKGVGPLPGPFTDNPIARLADDRLGFEPFVTALYQMARTADPLPFTVGVLGPWGSGKSSFMRMWQDAIAFAPRDRTLWFNPWKYDEKIAVWAALLQSLLAEVAQEATMKDDAAKLARSLTWLSLRKGAGAATAALTSGMISADTTEKAIDALTDQDRQFYEQLNRFELDFATTVGRWLGDEGRLFVFVDDLDRCTPEAAISVLEALKLFIGDARCVFVLAMDYDLISAVAARKFGEGAGVTGQAYLEKIIQLPFHLPEIPFGALRHMLAPAVGELGENDAFWELVESGLGNNPRRVKRFVNVFTLSHAILSAADRSLLATPDRSLQLAELLIIRSEFRDFFRNLSVDPTLWEKSRREQMGPVYHAGLLRFLSRKNAVEPPPPAVVRRMIEAARVTQPEI